MVGGAITVCEVYAPAADESIDAFSTDLQQEVHMAAKTDQMIIMGDFNVKVGDNYTKSIMGTHSIGERNERGIDCWLLLGHSIELKSFLNHGQQ